MTDRVADDELLYRRVEYGKNHYVIDPQSGSVRLSSQAFADKDHQISVDRALIAGDPTFTQQHERNAVVALMCRDVRRIDSVVENNDKGNEVLRHRIDVVPDPLDDNLAHALVIADPEYRKPKQVFRKLQEALARLAAREWVIHAWEMRTDHSESWGA